MKKNTKKKTIIILCVLLLLVSGISTYYYSRFIAPIQYNITTRTITSDNLPEELSNFHIAFFSDINIQTSEDILRLEEIVEQMNQQRFDMVVFGGDLYDDVPFDTTEVMNILGNINSTHGKFAVQGEKDLLYSNDIISILSDGGFEVLHNEYRKIHYQDTAFALFGLENNGDISGLLNEENQEMFKLVVVHEPDYFVQTAAQNIDLQLSGHSLGGYINLPLYGPVFRRTNAEMYVNGVYHQDQSTLIVSSGLGIESTHQYRLFTVNEVVAISLIANLQEDDDPIDETDDESEPLTDEEPAVDENPEPDNNENQEPELNDD